MGLRLEEIQAALPALESAERPIRAAMVELAAAGPHIDRTVGPVAAVSLIRAAMAKLAAAGPHIDRAAGPVAAVFPIRATMAKLAAAVPHIDLPSAPSLPCSRWSTPCTGSSRRFCFRGHRREGRGPNRKRVPGCAWPPRGGREMEEEAVVLALSARSTGTNEEAELFTPLPPLSSPLPSGPQRSTLPASSPTQEVPAAVEAAHGAVPCSGSAGACDDGHEYNCLASSSFSSSSSSPLAARRTEHPRSLLECRARPLRCSLPASPFSLLPFLEVRPDTAGEQGEARAHGERGRRRYCHGPEARPAYRGVHSFVLPCPLV